jgi:cytochrome c biogenesis protein CcmG/thiol:disulfide interchange protein DsbE
VRKNLPYIVPLVLFALLVAAAAFAMIGDKPAPANRLADVPAFEIPGLSDADLKDGIAVVNFFASWCGPCQGEHPLIKELAKKHAVYGIDFMDKPEWREKYLTQLGNPYKKVGDDAEGVAGAAWGVVGMPTTFIVQDGAITYRLDGPVTEALIKAQILPLLEGK